MSQEERQELKDLVSKGKTVADKIKHANMLLNIDVNGLGWTEAEAAIAFSCARNTVANLRQRLVEQGLETAWARQPHQHPRRRPVCARESEAKLMALRCGEPPAGEAGWTLRLLADTAVELEIVPAMSHETVRQVLKKMNGSPIGAPQDVIPPEHNAEFVFELEDVGEI